MFQGLSGYFSLKRCKHFYPLKPDPSAIIPSSFPVAPSQAFDPAVRSLDLGISLELGAWNLELFPSFPSVWHCNPLAFSAY
jgi:hypothetical protein